MVIENINVFDKLIENSLDHDLDPLSLGERSTCDDLSDDITEALRSMLIDDNTSLTDPLEPDDDNHNKIDIISDVSVTSSPSESLPNAGEVKSTKCLHIQSQMLYCWTNS